MKFCFEKRRKTEQEVWKKKKKACCEIRTWIVKVGHYSLVRLQNEFSKCNHVQKAVSGRVCLIIKCQKESKRIKALSGNFCLVLSNKI